LPNAETDEELVQGCLKGDQTAWTALIRRYRQLVFSVIRSYRLPDCDSADVFQCVCVELFDSLPRLRNVAALRRWVITVTGHQCYRVKQRIRAGLASDELLDDSFPDNESSASFQTFERQQLLREAMEDVSPRCRKMIELLFFREEPLAYSELAPQMGLAVGSIGFIRQRCLQKLKASLEKRGF